MRGPVLVLLLVATVQLLCVPGRYFGHAHDDAQDVLLSRSILRGHYTLGITPGDPPMTDRTPGMPLLFVPAAAVSGDLPAGYQLWAYLWLVLCDILVWLWLRRRMDPASACAAAACFGLNPVVLSAAGMVMPEVPFLALLMGLLLSLESERGLPGWLGGLWFAAAWFVRPAALPLFPAVWGWYLRKRRLRDLAACAACAALPVLTWWAWCHHAAGRGLEDARQLRIFSLMDWSGVLSTFGRTARVGLDSLGGSFGVEAWLFGALLAAVALAGIAMETRRRGYETAAVYVALGVGMHAIWPFWYKRYLVPFLPFLIWGLGAFAGRFMASDRVRAGALALLVLIPFPGQTVGLMRGASARCNPDFRDTYAWIRGHTEPQAMLTSVAFARDSFYAGRPFLSLPSAAAGPLADALRSRRVRYVLWSRIPDLGSTAGEAYYRELRRIEDELAGPEFRVVYSNPGEGTLVIERMK